MSKNRSDFWVVCWGIGVCFVLYLVLADTPFLRRRGRHGNQVVTMNNGKSLMLALDDFSSEYGGFPDDATAQIMRERTASPLKLKGEFSNDYFRQLIAAGVAKSEDPFYSQSSYSPRKPDNQFDGAECLKAGEVGFAYIMNGTKALPNDDPNRIIACAPVLNAAATGEFDPEPFKGYAMMVYLDSSVKRTPIRRGDHKVQVCGAKTLLENGADTIWGTAITPTIRPPQPLPGWEMLRFKRKASEFGRWFGIAAVALFPIGWWAIHRWRSRRECTMPSPS